ncbi:hypothetical protein GGR56DRAFT_669787 [Xylariaceae sp. FL0804]|nr:hypothetical protein GGR56DRAFT_669787 [Xylariaceae sp. FL0804]
MPSAIKVSSGVEKPTTLGKMGIKCGERTWKLHKAILCNRCKWFETALGGSFKEATSGIVTIENFQPDQIELLIKYIYTGELPRYHYTDEGWLESSITGIKLGDFFAMPEMCRKLLRIYPKTIIQKTIWVAIRL